MRRFWRDRSGGVAVMSAAGGVLACVTAAIVIDGASAAFYARQLQATADLAALAAARDVPRAQAAADATAQANMGDEVSVIATTGAYRADRERRARDRFSAAPANAANAVETRVTGPAPLWFAPTLLGRASVSMSRVGRAAVTSEPPMAMLTLGSRLARLDGGVANQLLSALTGSDVQLTFADYEGLADAQVNLLGFTNLLATELGVSAGNYDALLAHSVEAGVLLSVVERVSDGADPALARLARAAGGRRLRLGELIGLEANSPQGLRGALDAEVSVLDLAMATLEVAGGDRQVRFDLPVRAGLADVDAWLAIGERPNRSPWLTVDDDGDTVVRTAQARLFLSVQTAEAVARLGRVNIPLVVEIAAAEARLSDIRCEPGRQVDVTVRPGVARLRLGRPDLSRLDDFKSALAVGPAVLLDVAGLARVTGQADLNMASSSSTSLRFSDADIRAGATKTARSAGFVASPLVELLARLDLRVQALGLPIGLGGIGQAVAALVRPLAGVLDATVDQALAAIGLSLGEADVTVPQATCPQRAATPVLVG